MPIDAFLASFLGSLAVLVLGAIALVILAGWFLHSAAADSPSVRAFKRPLDAGIAAATTPNDRSATGDVRQDAPGRAAGGGAATLPLPAAPLEAPDRLRRSGCL